MRFGDATSSSDGFHTDSDVRLTLEILGFLKIGTEWKNPMTMIQETQREVTTSYDVRIRS